MQTILCDCEAIMNSRPLTYVSDDPTDLTPLTPSLFLQDVEEVGVPDLDLADSSDLNKRLKYRRMLKEDLSKRFRTEYLGQLQLHGNKNQIPYELSVGEVVLIGSDGVKRLNWPLARITELIKGKDGNVRIVRLRTQHGELLRPVQRVFPLELKSKSQESEEIADHLRRTTTTSKYLTEPIKTQDVLRNEDSSPIMTEDLKQNRTRRGRIEFLAAMTACLLTQLPAQASVLWTFSFANATTRQREEGSNVLQEISSYLLL
ncbi:uncharacterized protein LOC128996985 [Macrosteles quadrilineatus]|uniref:uncharacterized protein LOC128996985 n=1 Tax=Macrosteles quadrilineatus TaxID=74068 RepID=UPI0023E13852|nr:uncharacterized protein LOC128996985 [Macrosteles quadrilineatus]